MPSPARSIGVQSWCFRNFKDNAEVIRRLKGLGLDKIELCAVHCGFDAKDLAAGTLTPPPGFDDPKNHAPALAAYKNAGIQITSIGVQTFTGDEAKERHWFAFAKAAGAKYISAHFRVDSFLTAIPIARKLSQEYGVKLALHCHGGYMFGGSEDVVGHILKIGGDEIGLTIDTAWCMQTGHGDPVNWARKFAPKIYGVHYKDFVFDRAGKWSETIPGEGNLKLKEFVKALEETNFNGYAVLEYEAQPENPDPALAKGRDAVYAA